jgi:hypothetical protein
MEEKKMKETAPLAIRQVYDWLIEIRDRLRGVERMLDFEIGNIAEAHTVIEGAKAALEMPITFCEDSIEELYEFSESGGKELQS